MYKSLPKQKRKEYAYRMVIPLQYSEITFRGFLIKAKVVCRNLLLKLDRFAKSHPTDYFAINHLLFERYT